VLTAAPQPNLSKPKIVAPTNGDTTIEGTHTENVAMSNSQPEKQTNDKVQISCVLSGSPSIFTTKDHLLLLADPPRFSRVKTTSSSSYYYYYY